MANTSSGICAQAFTFSAKTLRVLTIDGEPWFVASDVCDALEHTDTSKAVSRLDDDEKLTRTMFASGQNREVLVINESGLYSLILTSRKPEAKKFKKWVTAEVLPSIRKTGRYEAPAQPPEAEAERLSANDFQNIRRVLWMVASHMRFESAWTQAMWHYLRRALGVPYPQAFTVQHLPRLATELHSVVCAAEQVNRLVEEIEREAARRIFRRGETASAVVAQLETLADARLQKLGRDMGTLPSYLQADMEALTRRLPNRFADHISQVEQPDFFSAHRHTGHAATGA